MYSQIVLSLLFFTSSIFALEAPLPRRTAGLAQAGEFGWTPAPTAAPLLRLYQRQQNSGPRTCGYINGSNSDPYTCDADAPYCGYQSSVHVAGCCSSTSVNTAGQTLVVGCDAFYTKCVDANAPWDDASQSDNRIGQCETDAPYCFQYNLSIRNGTYSAFGCTDVPSVAPITVLATIVNSTIALTSSSTGRNSSSSAVSSSSASSSRTGTTTTQQSSAGSTTAAAASTSSKAAAVRAADLGFSGFPVAAWSGMVCLTLLLFTSGWLLFCSE